MREQERTREIIREIALSRPDLASDLDYGPIPERQISWVETQLGTSLPYSFRDYLKAFAGGYLLGYPIYGIRPASIPIHVFPPVDIFDIVECNKELADRELKGAVLFSTNLGDYWFYLDTGHTDAHGECPILVHGPGFLRHRVASDFIEYLRLLAKGEPLWG